MLWIFFGLKFFLGQKTDEQLGNRAIFVLKYSIMLKKVACGMLHKESIAYFLGCTKL